MVDFVKRADLSVPLTWTQLDGNWDETNRRIGAGWSDIVSPITPDPADGPSLDVFIGGIDQWTFPFSVTETHCHATFHLNHDYDITGGSTPGMVYPHVHWSVNTTNTGTVKWGCEWTAARRSDDTGIITFSATNTIYFTTVISADSSYKHIISEAADGGGIPATALGVDALILCRFFRAPVASEFPDSVFMLTVDIHLPTFVAQTPSRTPPFT